MPKAEENKATDAAAKKATEEGVDLAKVEPSGASGQVTVTDVEEKAEELDNQFLVKINPDLKGSITSVGAFGRTFSLGVAGESISGKEKEALEDENSPEGKNASGVPLLVVTEEVK